MTSDIPTADRPQEQQDRATALDDGKYLYLVFEGGGAKGVVHVGAWAAIEAQLGSKPLGVAGTSAGALVACLIASGYSARSLIDPDAKTTLIDEIGSLDCSIRSAENLFTVTGWSGILRLRRFVDPEGLRVWAAAAVLAAVVCFYMVSRWLGSVAVSVLFTGLLTALFFGARYLARGIATLDLLRSTLDRLLRQKLNVDEPVKFKQYGPGTGRPTLKIVATNIDTEDGIELFSPERTPDVSVADAVAASICIPVVFPARQLAPYGRLLDGGILSNLPAWPFDEERRLDARTTTLAIEIGGDRTTQPAKPASNGSFSWIAPTVQTMIFGAKSLSTRMEGRLETIRLPCDLHVLDFDATKDEVFREVRAATDDAKARIQLRFIDGPEIIRDACERAREQLSEAVRELGGSPGKLRVGVGVRNEHTVYSLQLRYGTGYTLGQDLGLHVPLKDTLPNGTVEGREGRFERNTPYGLAWIQGVPLFSEVVLNRGAFVADGTPYLAGEGFAHIRARLRQDQTRLLLQPIRNDNSTIALIVVDSDRMQVSLEAAELLGLIIDAIFSEAFLRLKGIGYQW